MHLNSLAYCVTALGWFSPVLAVVQVSVQNQSEVVGSNATLNCSYTTDAVGISDVIVQWFKETNGSRQTVHTYVQSGNVQRPGQGYSGRTFVILPASLHLSNVSYTDYGTYICGVTVLATTSGGVNEKSFSLEKLVYDESNINCVVTDSRNGEPYDKDTTAVLRASVCCTHPEVTFTWYRVTSNANNTVMHNVINSIVPAGCPDVCNTTSLLSVTVTEDVEYRGSYTHPAVQGSVACPSSLKLKLKAGPNITSGLENRTVLAGGSSSFNCQAEGVPAPDIIWIKEATGEIVSNNTFLNFTNIDVTDSGWYVCNASSSFGTFDDRKIYIQVNGVTTTEISTGLPSTKVPPGPNIPVDAIISLSLAVLSFVFNCCICIVVYCKYQDREVIGIAAWFFVIGVSCCVILGDVCGGIAWAKIFTDQNSGIIAMGVILADLVVLFLGFTIGIIKGPFGKQINSDETVANIFKQLQHVVFSVATFGGVAIGITVRLNCCASQNRATGEKRHRTNSITPEGIDHSRTVHSANSKDSTASQSEVPLYEADDTVTTPAKENIEMEMKKKKKKKKNKTLPPLKERIPKS